MIQLDRASLNFEVGGLQLYRTQLYVVIDHSHLNHKSVGERNEGDPFLINTTNTF